nr:anti-CBASS Acb1 family protein [Candidatus Arsenophonus triatominarum]
MALDTEEAFFQINTPMTDLEKIASNYQEQLCIPSRMPVIKLLGNAPAGLNANGQGEIDVWHETISGIQERNIRPMIQQMLDYLFIAEFGQLLPEITFTFNPLDELTEKEMSEINLNNASMLANLATSSCISTMDVAQWLINNPKSGFAFMNGQENEDETDEKEGENT